MAIPAFTVGRRPTSFACPCPWPLQGERGVSTIEIHKRCAASLTRVLDHLWYEAGEDIETIKAWRIDRFSGSYVFRTMRGSSHISMHAYGAALDWDARDNPFHAGKGHHLFTADSPIVRTFRAESWVWLSDFDPMHFQAARLR